MITLQYLNRTTVLFNAGTAVIDAYKTLQTEPHTSMAAIYSQHRIITSVRCWSNY